MELERESLYPYNLIYSEETMIKQRPEVKSQKFEAGFTLVELMITMVIFVLVIAAASGIFTSLLNQFKQQSKIAETNIEGIIGLDMLRQDIQHAGLGLPWVIPVGVSYGVGTPESSNSTPCGTGTADPALYNDATTNPPRGINSGDNNCTNNSDYLVIKAASIARNWVAGKWTHLRMGDVKKIWKNTDGSDSNENVNKKENGTTDNTVRVIVIAPGSTGTNLRSLVASGGSFSTQYSNTLAYAPTDDTETYTIYGIDPDTNPKMPFNRADYYIRPLAVNELPRCAPGTGVLEKVTANHGDGGFNVLPLLDCVANMQVFYGVDIDTPIDGAINCYEDDLTTVLAPVNAANIRDRVKEVRIKILAHEGQFDRDFTYTPPTYIPAAPADSVRVGDSSGAGTGSLPYGRCSGGSNIFGHDFPLTGINNWQNYRWKVYTIVVKTENLR